MHLRRLLHAIDGDIAILDLTCLYICTLYIIAAIVAMHSKAAEEEACVVVEYLTIGEVSPSYPLLMKVYDRTIERYFHAL